MCLFADCVFSMTTFSVKIFVEGLVLSQGKIIESILDF